jgi:GntR family phosphonate transport system transcriptional regulator
MTSPLHFSDPAPPEGELPGSSPAARDLAWRQIARDLETAIRKGEHGVGAVLPTAPDLARRYGVNRHTVRRAFRHLAEAGLVSVSRGRGTEVLAPKIPYRIGRRVSLRGNLGKAGRTVTARLIAVAEAQAAGAVREMLRLKSGAPVWRVETLSLADDIPLSYARHTVSRDRFPDFPAALERNEVSVSAALAECGVADYIRLVTRLSARGATPEEARMLEIRRLGPVMRSIGLDALPDGTPIHLADTVFAGARMEMVIDLENEMTGRAP